MASTAIERPPATPEEIWTILRETTEIQKRTSEEADLRHKEFEQRSREFEQRSKEFEQHSKEFDRRLKETERLIKENGRQMGELHNSFGEIAEHLVCPGIVSRFAETGFHFEEISPGGLKLKEDGIIKAEIDILLENETTVMAVEVKSKVLEKDIGKHLIRLETLRDFRHRRGDKRRIYGAIAGAVFASAQRKAALDAGLYVIVQSGDTMRLDIPDGFEPREW